MKNFLPVAHGTQKVSLGAAAQQITLPTNSVDVWIDNRGSTDVLVEFADAPLDTNSFRVAGNTAQPLALPFNSDKTIWLKRPSGATQADVFVTGGQGS